MPQIRLTLKTIKELKTPLIHDISTNCEFFDDWYFDIFLVQRRKVYLFMHLETKVAFAMPSFEIGGIKGVFEFDPWISVVNKLSEAGIPKVGILLLIQFVALPLTKLFFMDLPINNKYLGGTGKL